MRNELVRIARALGCPRDSLPPDNQDAVEVLADFAERPKHEPRPRAIWYHFDTFTTHETPGKDGSSAYAVVRWDRKCNRGLACGSTCVLSAAHVVPCECVGDAPGYPGSCLA